MRSSPFVPALVHRSLDKLALWLLLLAIAAATPQLFAKKDKDKDKDAAPALNEQKRAVHALNRLAFGPRPGDLQRVMAIGVDHWIDQQLHPEKISDSAIESRLAAFRTLRMSSHEIAEEFPDGGLVRQVADGKKPMPSDPAKRAVYQVQIARQEEKKAEKEQAAQAGTASQTMQTVQASQPVADSAVDPGSASGGAKTAEELAAAAAVLPQSDAPGDNNSMAGTNSASMSSASNGMAVETAPSKPTPEEEAEAKRLENKLYADLEVQKLPDLPADQRYKKVLAMTVDQKVTFADSLRGGKGQEFLAGLDPRQKETLLAMNNPQGVVSDELMQAKLLRAIYSGRQLEEVMTDFWFNHFNVFIGKGADRVLITDYEQNVIRPRAMGKFEDLLVATAQSPAMLMYLDNWQSIGPDSMAATRVKKIQAAKPNGKIAQNLPKGINENYARELMELHTLGVNGGYTQQDVIEVAKCFTGWTIDRPYQVGTGGTGGFVYEPNRHEPGTKTVLGQQVPEGGEQEGLTVLHMLATSPATAHFISQKLAVRFVSDDPPAALVDAMAATFLKTGGDIKAVLRTMFHSPEFWSPKVYRAKVKTPIEFLASAVRASGADVKNPLPLVQAMNRLGMPVYGMQTPNGYSWKADEWVSSNALIGRMNFALVLSGNRLPGTQTNWPALLGDDAESNVATNPTPATEKHLEALLLGQPAAANTRDTVLAQFKNPTAQQDALENFTAKPASAEMDGGKEPNMMRVGLGRKGGGGPSLAQSAQPETPLDTMAGLLLGSPEFQRR